MLIEWKKEFSVGVVEVDEQHKKLLNMINLLYSSIQKKKPHVIINSIIQDMMEYTIYHFDTEEKVLKENGLDPSKQKKEHTKYIDNVGNIFQSYLQRDKEIYTKTIRFLWSWWKDHILETDKKSFAPLKK